MEKCCPKCKKVKKISDFNKNRCEKDGLQTYCRDCQRKINNHWCSQHRKELAEANSKWQKSNLEKCRARCRKYHHTHREQNIERCKRYREQNPDIIHKAVRNWQKNNLEKVKKIQQKRMQQPEYKVATRIRNQMSESLKGNKAGRHWEDLVGYALQELITHLKTNIPDGYTWQDYLDGKLHLDHIIPIAAFSFSKPEDNDFKRCWALENLQLLTARENLRKGAKVA